MVKETYKLMDDGRVQYTFVTDISEFKNKDEEKLGEFYNTSVTYLDNKEIAIKHLEEQYIKTNEDLESMNKKFDLNIVDLELFKNLKAFDDKAVEVLTAIKEVKDYSETTFVKENPKKYSKVLRDANILKSNVVAHLTELDKQIRMYNEKDELQKQIKLYSEQSEKMKKQLEEVKKL